MAQSPRTPNFLQHLYRTSALAAEPVAYCDWAVDPNYIRDRANTHPFGPARGLGSKAYRRGDLDSSDEPPVVCRANHGGFVCAGHGAGTLPYGRRTPSARELGILHTSSDTLRRAGIALHPRYHRARPTGVPSRRGARFRGSEIAQPA